MIVSLLSFQQHNQYFQRLLSGQCQLHDTIKNKSAKKKGLNTI